MKLNDPIPSGLKPRADSGVKTFVNGRAGATLRASSDGSITAGAGDGMNKNSDSQDLLKNSSLYREFQAEREEIMKHKWIESEKAGHDIGFEMALTDWIVRHRARWRRARQLEKDESNGDKAAE